MAESVFRREALKLSKGNDWLRQRIRGVLHHRGMVFRIAATSVTSTFSGDKKNGIASNMVLSRADEIMSTALTTTKMRSRWNCTKLIEWAIVRMQCVAFELVTGADNGL